jgi:1,4-dihydroxy-2-naphthoate octaprenyltransferase
MSGRGVVRVWLRELRLPFLGASLVAVLLGTAAAYHTTGLFSVWPFVLALLATALVHSGANVCNDYFDHVQGTDRVNVSYIRPFTGGSRVIQRGELTPRTVLRGGLLLLGLGAAVGVVLAAMTTWAILWVGAAGVLAGYFYSAPPVRFASRGLGELVIALTFGMLVPVGGWFTQVRTFAPIVLAAATPLAMLIAAVIVINEVPDIEADADTGKRTLAVRLGGQRALGLHAVLALSASGAVAAFVLSGTLPREAALGLLAALPAAAAFYNSLVRGNLLPACALTATAHALTGLLLSLGFLLAGPPS